MYSAPYNSQNKSKYHFLLFLISPVAAFLYGLKNYRTKHSRKYILLFCLFYSISYIPIPNSDATRYESRIQSIQAYTFSSYVNEIKNMYNADAINNDAYVHTVFFILTPFTRNIIVYRLFFGFVYFSVYLALFKAIKFTMPSVDKRFNWFIIGIIFLISFTSGINGIRWPLALMVFLLGYFKYIKEPKLKYLLLVSSSFFIHFIAGYIVFFFFVFIITQKFYNPITSLILLVATFAFNLAIVSSIKSNISTLGDGVGDRTSGYIENNNFKENRETHLQNLNWYVRLNRYSTNYFVLIVLVVSILFDSRISKSKFVVKLEYFAILMFIASFLSAQLLDSLSNRFYLSANAAGLIYLYFLYEENKQSRLVNSLRIIYIPIALLQVAIIMRGDLYTMSPNLIFGNVFSELFYKFEDSIQTLLTGSNV